MPSPRLRNEPYTVAEIKRLQWSHSKDSNGWCMACGRESCRFARWFATVAFMSENKGQLLEGGGD